MGATVLERCCGNPVVAQESASACRSTGMDSHLGLPIISETLPGCCDLNHSKRRSDGGFASGNALCLWIRRSADSDKSPMHREGSKRLNGRDASPSRVFAHLRSRKSKKAFVYKLGLISILVTVRRAGFAWLNCLELVRRIQTASRGLLGRSGNAASLQAFPSGHANAI